MQNTFVFPVVPSNFPTLKGLLSSQLSQPGEKHAAIDGDGHTIYKLEFFARSVPPAWLDEIAAKLYHEHELGGCDKGGPSVVWGVWALEFHY